MQHDASGRCIVDIERRNCEETTTNILLRELNGRVMAEDMQWQHVWEIGGLVQL